jgi:predicted ABC-type ATPase
MPQIYLVGGPNGSGKTTSAFSLLSHELTGTEFVNADIIAAQLNPECPENAAFQAGRMMIERIEELFASNSDFIFESTLSTRSFAPFLQRSRKANYTVTLFYFWLSSADLAIERVADRVRSGGHSVPSEDVRRRYDRSISNLRKLYIPLADLWLVFDNSSGSSRQIAEGSQNDWITVYDKQTWELITGVQDG